jgi:hypothetical protein
LKFQGVLQKPLNSNPISVQVKLRKNNSTWQTDYQSSMFNVDDQGVWTGRVTFANVTPGSGYLVYVKGPKHLQKKICDATPTESSLGSGTYSCQNGNITLQSGENNFDFTGILLLGGDLPVNGRQDGVINALDTAFVRNSIGKTDAATAAIADINLDGMVDTQDWSIVLQTLSIKGDDL